MTRRRLAAVGLATVLGVLLPVQVAVADESGRIVEVKREGDALRIVFRADGLPDGVTLDPESVKVRVAEHTVGSSADFLTSGDAVTQVAVLAIDNSQSMKGERLAAAKSAATTFLSTLPRDVQVGVVTFADIARTEVRPTTDRAEVRTVIDNLQLNERVGTALFDGLAKAADLTGSVGARSVLLLTDGDEDGHSETSLEDAAATATADDVAVDAVYIGPPGEQPPELTELMTEAGGQVVSSDPADLETIFQDAAEAIGNQLLIEAELPSDVTGFGNVEVRVMAGDTSLEDSAFRSFSEPGPQVAPNSGPVPVQDTAELPAISRDGLPVILGALFLGLVTILFVAMSTIKRDEKQGRVRRRLSLYTLTGRPSPKQEPSTTALGSSQIARSAVELAGKVVQRRDFEATLALKLDAAGVPLRAAEWMLIQVGVAIGVSVLLLLVSGGSLLPSLAGLIVGLALPWVYLTMKESRRTAAFLAQLPDTLQLVSGSLSAGYSTPQAMDSVVREGQQPITGEFNRALVEARLGVPIEDAMDGIAERMKSKDFAWVVMAIRIQREVGGNLAELLTTVAATLRERERLRRQVSMLSAEGRLSAWILGLLPITFALYLVLVRPEYLQPLVTDPIGWLLLGLGAILLLVGVLWLRKAIKVEV
jgi:tight adherence protein B